MVLFDFFAFNPFEDKIIDRCLSTRLFLAGVENSGDKTLCVAVTILRTYDNMTVTSGEHQKAQQSL